VSSHLTGARRGSLCTGAETVPVRFFYTSLTFFSGRLRTGFPVAA
jgi:hypothetical protein